MDRARARSARPERGRRTGPVPPRGSTWRDDLDGAGAAAGRLRAGDPGPLPGLPELPRRRRPRRRVRRPPWLAALALQAALAALLFLGARGAAALPPPVGPAVRHWLGVALTYDLDLPGWLQRVRHGALGERAARLVSGAWLEPAADPVPPLVWPVAGRPVARFGWRQGPDGKPVLHEGIDIAAREGTPVVAAAAGTVVRVDRDPHGGLRVELDHGRGVRTRYAQLGAVTVAVGERVAQGRPLGTVGKGGEGSGPHLHFELLVDGRPVDPEPKLPPPDGS